MKYKVTNIDINSPREVMNLYSERLFGEKEWENLKTDELQGMFSNVLTDFYSDGLGIDVLSSIGSFIFDQLGEDRSSDFAGVVLAASELGYYIRNTGEKEESGKYLISILEKLKRYSEDNKLED